MRRFLEEDDGRGFFMLNVFRRPDSALVDPVTGKMRAAREVMMGYTLMLILALFARGGHIASAGRQLHRLTGPGVHTPPS